MIHTRGDVTAEFDRETGKLLFFMNLSSRLESGSFTVDDAEDSAEDFIKSIYGKKALKGYELTMAGFDESEGKITIKYNKVICGVECDDWVRVRFNLEGEIITFTAKSYGILNDVEDKITSERIKKAREALVSSLDENCRLIKDGRTKEEFNRISIDTKTGICYLVVIAEYIPSGYAGEYCINIF